MRRIAALFAPLLAIASPAAAFWEYGHETVARIAEAAVTPTVHARIARLLRASALLETPKCPARTMAEASIWADCIKTLGPRFSYAYSWHYQNVDICRPFDLKAACRDGNCVSAQITRDVALLKDRLVPVRERVMALTFLIHLVGDLHQPLHAGDHADLGGNRVKAVYGAGGVHTNLHAVWDGYLAERAISTPPAGARGLIRAVPPAERAAMQAGTVEDWSRESWAVARDAAYPVTGDACAGGSGQPMLDEARIKAAIPAMRVQVERGGFRLAKLLNDALG